MRKTLTLILCLFFIIPLITGCGESLKFWKKKKEVEVVNKKLPPFESLFNHTIEMYNAKQYKDAIQALLFLRENYPQKKKYQSRITLYLADSHYNLGEYLEAIANYEEFIKLYPTSPDVPYAYFQIGMSNYKQRRTYDRDATFIRKAIGNFEKVLQIAPPGVLINESIRMIAFCQRELAMHDLFIADFYMRTHHYNSAVFRYEDVLNRFYNLKIHDRAHLGIAKAYLKLKNTNEAFRHLSYVAKNFPNSPYGKEAWKLLQKKFKVASLDQLPDVTFPKVMPVKVAEAQKAMPVKKKVVAHQKKETAAKEEIALKAPSQATHKKINETKKEPEIAAKPHIYFPKISKVQEKPSVYAPPVKKVVKPATPKPTPTQKVAAAPKTQPSVAKAPKVTKPAKKSITKPKKKAAPPIVLPARPMVYSPPVVKVVAAPPVKTAKMAPVRVSKNVVAKAPPKKPAKNVKKSQKVASVQKKPTPKPTKAVKKPTKKASPPPKVGKMVKTDRLPPKKQKGNSGSSLGPVGAIDTRLPIHISSDHVEAKQKNNSVRFYGNVVVKQKDVTLKCEDLTAYYTANGKAIDKIIAHKRVSIIQQNKKVSCGKAIFYNAARKIVLEGSPSAWDGDNKISGDKMILLLEKNEIQILGSKKKPTELVIYPDKK